MSLEIGAKIPNFSVHATHQNLITEENLMGRFTILYFYPKDNTPGCTNEGLDFASHYPQLQSLNTQVFGVSKDSLKKHHNFKDKYHFPFELIADEDELLCQLFDVIKLKKNYGREYMGIERSTFLINPQAELVHEWRKVKVKEHVNEVIQTIQQL